MSTSRYANVGTAVYVDPEGRRFAYRLRRFPPHPEPGEPQRQVVVLVGDRPDLVAARSLGDPLLFWRIADANPVLDPFELTEQPGAEVVVPGVAGGPRR